MKRFARGSAATAALLAAAVALLGASGTQDAEEELRCHGRRPTILGTPNADFLRGTAGRDVIAGGAGDDTILGIFGNDLLCGGPGSDLIHGGRGNDVIDGGAGDGDRVIGDLGDDKVLGGPGNGDEVAGSLGIDTISGGPGNFDLVHGDYGNDRMDGGSGSHDIASFATDVASSKGAGVRVSLTRHRARGDGHDRLFRVEDIEGSAFRDVLTGNHRANVIDGGPGDDHLFGGGGADTIDGGQGSDGCAGAKGRTISCGSETAPKGSAYLAIEPAPGGGGGLVIVAGRGDDDLTLAFDEANGTFAVTAAKGIALGRGCLRLGLDRTQAICNPQGPARWLTVDLGPGNDRFRVEGSLTAVESVRLAGGPGNDVIHGGPEDDLIESGRGADRLYGEAGSDGLVGGLPGPTSLYGGADGDLLAAGGGCAGGRLVGGPGRDNASFAETQAHPGVLIISLPRGKAWIDAIRGCDPVGLAHSDEDIEGSFDNDVLEGDSRSNSLLGQPGSDVFYGNGGEDVIDARDGVRDESIQCGRGHPAKPKRPSEKGHTPLIGKPAGRALTDAFDPSPVLCSETRYGTPVAGLNNKG